MAMSLSSRRSAGRGRSDQTRAFATPPHWATGSGHASKCLVALRFGPSTHSGPDSWLTHEGLTVEELWSSQPVFYSRNRPECMVSWSLCPHVPGLLASEDAPIPGFVDNPASLVGSRAQGEGLIVTIHVFYSIHRETGVSGRVERSPLGPQDRRTRGRRADRSDHSSPCVGE